MSQSSLVWKPVTGNRFKPLTFLLFAEEMDGIPFIGSLGSIYSSRIETRIVIQREVMRVHKHEKTSDFDNEGEIEFADATHWCELPEIDSKKVDLRKIGWRTDRGSISPGPPLAEHALILNTDRNLSVGPSPSAWDNWVNMWMPIPPLSHEGKKSTGESKKKPYVNKSITKPGYGTW
ncbi:MAG: hypothetical protein ACXWT0_01875 [Methylobacter sp.]